MIAARAEESAVWIRSRVSTFPAVAVVLGSGMGAFVDEMTESSTLPYADIPNFPVTGVAGHRGNLVVGTIRGVPIAAMQGRFHHYEGHDLAVVTFPVRVLRALGVRTLILTAATGGIRGDLRPGDLMALSDHLNLLGINPLRGPNEDDLGPRFPDMTEVYSPRLRGLAQDLAAEAGFTVKEGVYACLPGPSYETPAEIRMLRTLGADVVGMSTVPEAIVARHAGMEVAAFAIVANAAAGLSESPITHEDVLAAVGSAGPRLSRLIAELSARIQSD